MRTLQTLRTTGLMAVVLLAGLTLAVWTGAATQAQTIDLANAKIVDLTHTFDQDTIYWPTAPSKFVLTEDAYGESEGGWFYASYSLSTPEHGGTHLDAPIHFHRGGQTTDQIPLGQLIGPAAVIDISAKAAADPDYRLTVDDIRADEAANGPIPEGAIILLRTSWSLRWPDALAYFGDDTPGDAANLHFPGYGEAAARLLVEDRGAKALGVDTASIDYGQSKDFLVHRAAFARNVPGLENLTALEALPPRGATVIALPMKIGGGSGGPVRVVALIPGQ